MKHKLIAALLAGVLTCNFISMEQSQIIHADEGETDLHCTYYTGTNIGRQNYNINHFFNAADTNASSLVPLADGRWMRVQGEVSALNGAVLAEYYNADFQLLERKIVPKQLPKYGGFHAASDGCYYLVTGQDNISESTSQPVFDIAKYTADWELVGHDQLCGANTAKAFEAGCVRCADNGKYLVVHSSHEMFNGSTSQGHQSSFLIEFDMETAKVSDHSCNFRGAGRGCVSHSFNQFVLMNGTKLVTLDHGDAYPRYVVLNEYISDFTTGTFKVNYSNEFTKAVDMFDYYPKKTEENYTGVTVGGFEQSSTHYLTVLNTVDQSKWEEYAAESIWYDNDLYMHTHNIVVSSVPKDNFDNDHVQKFEITNFAEGEPTTHTPHLTPIDGDRFLLLWQQSKTVNYVFLDNTGAPISEIYTMDGEMSDCKPVMVGSQVYWYTWKNQDVTLYSIDVSDPEQTNTVVSNTAHDYHLDEEPDENGILHDTCSKCGDVLDHTIPTSMNVVPYYLKYSSGMLGFWYSFTPSYKTLDAGDQISLYVKAMEPMNPDSPDSRCVTEIIDGEDVVHLTNSSFRGNPVYEIDNFGNEKKTFTLKIYPYYNPGLAQTFTMTVGHHYEISEVVEPPEDHKGLVIWKCTGCGHTKDTWYEPFAANNDMIPEVTLSQDTFVYNGESQIPEYTFTLKDPQTGEKREMKKGSDFEAVAIHNTEAGTAYLVISPLQNSQSSLFKGILTVPYTIRPRTQEDVIPCPDGHTLEITDFTLPVYTTKGTVTWTCSKCGYETQTEFEPFEAPGSFRGEVVFSQDTFEYDHSAHKPQFNFYLTNDVTGDRSRLLPETDYNYYYTNNVHAGTANLVIIPQTHTPENAKFKGVFVAEFTIEPQDLTGGRLTFLPSTFDPDDPETDMYSYVRPQFVVRDKQGYVLEENDYYPKGMHVWDEDYLRRTGISFSLSAKSPDYTRGIGGVYEIPLVDISAYDAVFADADLRSSANIAYTGEAVEPPVKVTTSKGRVLEQDVDYRLFYQNNTELGTATVIIEGIGYYEGTIALHFDIVPEIHSAPPSHVNGDLDGDGELSTEDARSLADILTGKTEISEETWKAADFNNDGTVNAVDLTLLKQLLLTQ